VSELEAQAYEDGILFLRKDPVPQKVQIRSASEAISKEDRVLRARAFRRIELLQDVLVRIERYRHNTPESLK
jgi:hypothetical protein